MTKAKSKFFFFPSVGDSGVSLEAKDKKEAEKKLSEFLKKQEKPEVTATDKAEVINNETKE